MDSAPDSASNSLSRAIPENVLAEWQTLVDTMAELLGVPAGLIRCVEGSRIAVLIASRTAGNPYHAGDSMPLPGSGLYCEDVIRNGRDLLIADARQGDDKWQQSPDVEHGMLSYLGYPILWPDKSSFGTICVLDDEAHAYPAVHRRLIEQFRDFVELHLTRIPAPTKAAIDVAADGASPERPPAPHDERFRLLVEHAADDFFLHDDKGRFLNVNARACVSTGYSREELLRMNVTDISLDHNQQEAEEIWTRTQPGQTSTVYSHHRRRDGSAFPVEVHISCELVGGRKLFLGMVRDISERVAAEGLIRQLNAELEQRVVERTRQWRASADLLQTVMNETTDLVFTKDRAGRYLVINAAAARVLGRPVDEILGKHVSELLDAETADALSENDRRVLQGGETIAVEETITVDAARHIFASTKAPYRDANGDIIGLIGIARDMTAIKGIEDALRKSELRWQFALEGSGDGIWDRNFTTGQIFVSRQVNAMLG